MGSVVVRLIEAHLSSFGTSREMEYKNRLECRGLIFAVSQKLGKLGMPYASDIRATPISRKQLFSKQNVTLESAIDGVEHRLV